MTNEAVQFEQDEAVAPWHERVSIPLLVILVGAAIGLGALTDTLLFHAERARSWLRIPTVLSVANLVMSPVLRGMQAKPVTVGALLARYALIVTGAFALAGIIAWVA